MKPDKATADKVRPEDETDAAAGQTDSDSSDARERPEKLKENRERLGVDDEHKTPDMKEHHRGTFP